MEETKSPVVLRYVDRAERAIANLPPRDLTQADLDGCQYSIEQILQTGIYAQGDQGDGAEETTTEGR